MDLNKTKNGFATAHGSRKFAWYYVLILPLQISNVRKYINNMISELRRICTIGECKTINSFEDNAVKLFIL